MTMMEMLTDAYCMVQDHFAVNEKATQEQFRSVAVEIADLYNLDLADWLEPLLREIQYYCY